VEGKENPAAKDVPTGEAADLAYIGGFQVLNGILSCVVK